MPRVILGGHVTASLNLAPLLRHKSPEEQRDFHKKVQSMKVVRPSEGIGQTFEDKIANRDEVSHD